MHLRTGLLAAVCLLFCAALPPLAAAQGTGSAPLASRATAQEALSGREGAVQYYIAPGEPGSRFRDEDRDLALWALAAWERSAHGALHFEPGPEESALLRIYWVGPGGGEYGETRPLVVGGLRGAAVYIRPDTEALGSDIAARAAADPLFRDTVVYLTCLHEIGHAIGLVHTADFRDVMYFFGFGGDIPAFFDRYRTELKARKDIADVTGLSEGDLRQLQALYSEPVAADD